MGDADGMVVPQYFITNKKNDESRQEFQSQTELFNVFTPMIHYLADKLINSDMDERYCPSIPNFKADETTSNRKHKRAASAHWSKKKKQEVEASDNGNLVIFVIGGITYEEVQAAYELMAKHNINVYIGGTHLVTATNFVEQGLPEMSNR